MLCKAVLQGIDRRRLRKHGGLSTLYGLDDLQEGVHDKPMVLSDEFKQESVRNEEEELETHGGSNGFFSDERGTTRALGSRGTGGGVLFHG